VQTRWQLEGTLLHIHLDPVLFQWGPITLRWHGLWHAAGALVAYLIFVHEGRRKGIERRNIDELVLLMALCGYLGARLLYVLGRWEVYAAQPLRILAVHEGGLAVFGVLVGATISSVVYTRRKNLPFWDLADAFVLGFPAGQIVGRVGCLIAGDIWGVPTHGSWGLVYWHPNATVPSFLLGVPTWPAPIMLQLWAAGLLVLLLVLRTRWQLPGAIFATYVILYATGRFIVGIWQPGEPFLLGLKKPQAVALALMTVGVGLLFYLRARAPSPSDARARLADGTRQPGDGAN
jgi:phosphatidylglycerol:prolipoprotein diacylglycerol transferase